jgi:membrane dipeptidase
MPDDTAQTVSPEPSWFDAHLDLAFLAETGRDMHTEPEESRGRYQPAAVTLPSLAAGGVRRVLATVFTEAVTDPSAPDAETGAFAYPLGNRDAAFVCGMRQLKLYHAWQDAGLIALPNREPAETPASPPPLRAGVLVENADPITGPDDLDEWVAGGVVAIGLAWATRGHYACGNGVPSGGPGTGLSDAGRALVRRMDELGVVHDASHLNDRSLADLFDATDARVVASHSNCRALMDGENQRHLTDDAIREIVRRDGIIGLNLCSSFLDQAAWKSGRATIDDCVRHIEHICDVAGDRTHVGMGSDMDGGFTAARLPAGIDRPGDMGRIADALRDKGWGDAEIADFREGNWRRVFDL